MNKLTLLLFLFCFATLAHAQINVSGVIISEEDGLPAIGATVQEKGTSNGTLTDIDGKYSLQVSNKDATLIVSYVGLETQEIPLAGRREVPVTLRENVSLLNEVVVMGYGTQLRSNISGTVSTISTEEIAATPILRVEQALQGRSSGVQVAQNSGSPGSALSVRIRGTGTINNSDPIYIVDGFRIDGFNDINPNDIESISILKDGASSAIYGANGANGVVLITTKKGKTNQRPSISYNMYYGLQSPWKKINLLNAKEYAILSNEARIADGLVPYSEFSNPESLGEGTDWQEAIFETAPIQSHHIAITGGTKSSTYAVNAGHFLQDGIVGGEKSGFKRTTFRVNNTHSLFDRIKIGNILSYTHLKRNGLPENNEFNSPVVRALNMDPVTPITKPDGTYAYSAYSDTDITNPVNALALSNDTWTTNRFIGNVFGELEIIEGLKFKSTYSLDASLGTRDVFNPSFDLSNDPELGDAPAQEKRLINNVLQEDNKYLSWLSENTLTYTKNYGERHYLTALAGYSISAWQHTYHGGTKAGLPTNDLEAAFISNGQDETSSRSWGGREENSSSSYFGRINYELDDKYLLSAVMRADGSSKFGKNYPFGYFPSVSAGWVISREDFFNVDWLSFLKLRASWGQNGNSNIPNYEFTTPVVSGLNYTLGTGEVITNGSAPERTSNPDLRWENSTHTDIGIDIELFDGQINFTTDYYIKKTIGMLSAVPIPLIAGFDAGFSNASDAVNRGVELELEYKNKNNPFQYSLEGNITFIKNEVTNLGDGVPISIGNLQSAGGNVSRTDVGYPIGSFYGYVTDGIFQNQAELETHATQSGAQPGDIRFKDLNDDGVIDQEDQTYIGNPIPKFTYGFTGQFDYKGIDFSLFLQGVQGNDIYNGTVRYDFSYANKPVSALNRWTGEGTSTSEPRATVSDPNQNARISDRFVEKGSYLRIKNLQLGYTLPKNLLANMKMRKFRVYIAAQNLFTFTQYSGLDPEIGTGNAGPLDIGIDRGFYPQSRTYLTGLSITF